MGAHRRGCLVAAALSAAVMGLHRVGEGALSAPRVRSWDAATVWYGEVGPAMAVMSMMRLVALAVALWLAAAAVLQVAGGSGRRLQRLADAFTPVLVRRLIQGAAGVTMSLGATVPAVTPLVSVAGAQPAPGADATATMRPLDDESVPHPGTAPAPATPPAASTGDVEVDAPSDSEQAPAVPVTAEAEEDVYHVAVGSHFWSIAEEIVGDSLGREPSDGEVTRYWLELIEANRDRLVVPENPDLLYPQQVLRLPAM